MALIARCPDCGLKSSEIRCPRCNALKVTGCAGECLTCGRSCEAGVASPRDEPSGSGPASDHEGGAAITE